MTEDDLKVKIGTREEAEFTEILEREEEHLLKNRVNAELAEVIIEYCKKRIAEEQKSLNSSETNE